jgi:hypothetical protein
LLESDQIIAADVCGQDGMVWGDGQSRGGEKQLAISGLQPAAAGEFAGRLRWLSGLQSPTAGGPAVFVKNHRWLRLATGQVGSDGPGTPGCPAAVSGQQRTQRQADDCCGQGNLPHRCLSSLAEHAQILLSPMKRFLNQCYAAAIPTFHSSPA